MNIAGIKSSRSFEKYLGLPIVIWRSKAIAFHSLINKTWIMISNWKTKALSVVGKEVLIKAILQVIPTYTMGIFVLPHSITQRLNMLLKKILVGLQRRSLKDPVGEIGSSQPF